MGTVWVLNLDAEFELAGRAPSRTVVRATRAISRTMLPFIGQEDSVLSMDDASRDAIRGRRGQCWCPTRKALETLSAAGAIVPKAPSEDVLRKVNHRAFCASMGQTLESACYATTETQVLHALQGAQAQWLLKRPLSMAGRGIRRVAGQRVSAEDLAWIRATLRKDGGVQIEPRLDIDAEFSMHAYLEVSGQMTTGEAVLQQIDAHGIWRAAMPAGNTISADEAQRLYAEVHAVGAALHRACYFGPFGVDAFRYRVGNTFHFQPRSEINARYTMAWGIAGPKVRL